MENEVANIDLDCFGCLKSPDRLSIFAIDKEEMSWLSGGDAFNSDADMIFFKGKKSEIEELFARIHHKLSDKSDQEWWTGDDETFYAIAFYNLKDGEALIACQDEGSGTISDCEGEFDIPEGCETTSVVHANKDRCMEENTSFFGKISHLFVF